MQIYNSYDDLINNMIIINNENPQWIRCNNGEGLIPMSNKYFLSLFDIKNNQIENFLNYINDNTRSILYPFKKEFNIDYSFMIEHDQIFNIDIYNHNLLEILNRIEQFFNITQESEADVILIIDINFLRDFLIDCKKKINQTI